MHIIIDDQNGQPNPADLARVYDTWPCLADLECIARASISALTTAHELDLITSPAKQGELSLGFTVDKDGVGETVFVEFSGREIVDWVIVD